MHRHTINPCYCNYIDSKTLGTYDEKFKNQYSVRSSVECN